MSDREKLIELWETAEKRFVDFCRGQDNCKSCPYNKYGFKCSRAYIIANLISNGVTVQKWTPVSERLPTEEDANDYESVLAVGRTNRCVREMVWYAIARYPRVFTHWMPLPEPPKECE